MVACPQVLHNMLRVSNKQAERGEQLTQQKHWEALLARYEDTQATQEIWPFLDFLASNQSPEIQETLQRLRTEDERTLRYRRPLLILRRQIHLAISKLLGHKPK